jgi:hypothetical protein
VRFGNRYGIFNHIHFNLQFQENLYLIFENINQRDKNHLHRKDDKVFLPNLDNQGFVRRSIIT